MHASGRAFLIVLIVVIICSTEERNWRHDRRPKIMGQQILLRNLIPNNRKVQKKIVLYHNFFRTNVVPRAANMLRMKWHRGAAKAAQKWASKCLVLTHDNVTGRHIHNYGACGQNIFIATEKVPWLFAIKTWYLEKDNFTYASKSNKLEVVGHYTQMVWAATHEIGCGVSKCLFKNTDRKFYNYVCNYCPIGNRPGQLGRPYRQGRPCGMCRSSCHAKRLCTNSCPVADFWSNCRSLYRRFPHWLCLTFTTEGRERSRHCQATCKCRNRIHD